MQSIIKKAQLASPGAQRPPSKGAEPCAPGVRLLSSDGLVHALEITCSCGEVALVELDYPPAAEERR
jgi:hypothetical protein